MKKLIYSIAFITLVITGCSKKDDSSSDNDPGDTIPTSPITAVPSTFTQKVLIEEFTGTWCGYCPDGATRMQAIITAHPTTAIGVAVHQGDIMELPLYNALDGVFNVTGFPTGMVGRAPYSGSTVIDRGQWSAAATTLLANTAKCGLALETALAGTDSVSITVHCGFNEVLTGDYRLTVYLVEDSVTGGSSYNQSNYYNTTAGSPFFGLGNPIVGYKHNHVARKVVTADLGTPIPAANIIVGTDYKVSYKAALTGFNKTNMHVVAFISKYGTSSTTHKIQNVQQVHLGDSKNWD